MISPISPNVSQRYRQGLQANDSPSFIDTEIPITPVVVVNSPQSPVLTASFRRGNLRVINGDTSITGTGSFAVQISPGSGKRWQILGYELNQGSGTYTITGSFLKFIPENGGDTINLATGTSSLRGFLPILLIVQGAEVVRMDCYCSAYTSTGTWSQRLLVYETQEETTTRLDGAV